MEDLNRLKSFGFFLFFGNLCRRNVALFAFCRFLFLRSRLRIITPYVIVYVIKIFLRNMAFNGEYVVLTVKVNTAFVFAVIAIFVSFEPLISNGKVNVADTDSIII